MFKRGKLVKAVNILLLLTMIITVFAPVGVLAEDLLNPDASSTDNVFTSPSVEMNRSLINFFKGDRSELDIDNVSRDEVIIYGIFLSNFFMPGKTTIKDIVKDDALPKQISEKFFGTPDRVNEVLKINEKIYGAINNGIKGDVFKLRKGSANGEHLTGSDLFKMFSQDNKVIYTSKGSTSGKINLNDPIMQAAFKVLFGVVPDLIVDKEKGLRSFGGLYMDGFGNIWGEPLIGANGERHEGGSVTDDYVLIMPACLNPITFSGGNSGLKFPMTNAFVMGASPVINLSTFDRSGVSVMEPYYTIKNYFKSSSSNNNKDINNMLSIFGVTSPIGGIGNSDNIFKSGTADNYSKVKDFVTNTASVNYNKSNTRIVIAIDINKASYVKDKIRTIQGFTDDEKANFSTYFTSAQALSLDQIHDEMYYFKYDNGRSASNSEGVSWESTNVTELLASQRLFVKSDKELYPDSFTPSPFNMFLGGYLSASNKEQYLKSKFPNISNKDLKNLRSFLETGKPADKSASDITSMFNVLLKSKPNERVYNILEKPIDLSFNVGTKLNTLPGLRKFRGTAFALTENDSEIAKAALSIFHPGYFSLSNLISKDGPHPRFDYQTAGGGVLQGSFSDADKNVLANLVFNFTSYRIFSMNYKVASQLTGKAVNSQFTTHNGKTMTVETFIANEVNSWPGIYWSYIIGVLGVTADGDVGQFDNKTLPYMVIEVAGGSINLNDLFNSSGVSSDSKSFEEMQKDIISKIYGLLSLDHSPYRFNWMKVVQDDWFVNTHRTIVGSWVGNTLSVSSGVVNSYVPVVGYINNPTLAEIPFTAWIIDEYVNIYVLLLLLVFIFLTIAVLINQRSIRDAFLIFLLLAVVLVLPQTFLNNTINFINYMNDKIYSDRFNYWALLQHQQSFEILETSLNSSDSMDYLTARTFEDAKNTYSSDPGVRVKWMSPKKASVFDQLFTTINENSRLTSNLTIFKWLFSSFGFQEEYVYRDPFATYVYRPYNDIAREAHDNYSRMVNIQVDKEAIKAKVNDRLKSVLGVADYEFSLLDGKLKHTQLPKDVLEDIKTASVYGSADDSYRYWGYLSDEVLDAIFRSEYANNSEAGLTANLDNDEVKAFLLYTESPFYYFYNVLKHRYSSINGGFKSALLTQDVFRVVNTDNPKLKYKLRDFLDMEGLFTYVIPLLNRSNAYVYGWTSIYGKDVEGYDFNKGNYSPELEQRFMEAKSKKEQLKNVWMMYSPWVASLHDLDVYNKKVLIAKKKYRVANLLNPGAYDEAGRPMIFSEADMVAKRCNTSNLSDIEMRIQRVLEKTYKDMMYLVNYYDLKDEVLITAAAMMATFNFNSEFSEPKILGESINLYPQGFEIKNFNYDAFMKMTLMNATGEPLMGNQDLYVRIITKSSFIAGLLLILNDVIAVVLIPACKIIVILLLFILGVMMCLSSIIKPPDKIVKTILDGFIVPTAKFAIYCVLFSVVVSFFMGEGLTGYVGSKHISIVTNDPTITLALLVIVGGVFIYLLFLLIRQIFGILKPHSMIVALGAVGLVSGVVQGVVEKVYRDSSHAVNNVGGRLRSKLQEKLGGKFDLGGGSSLDYWRSRLGEKYDKVKLDDNTEKWSNIHRKDMDNFKALRSKTKSLDTEKDKELVDEVNAKARMFNKQSEFFDNRVPVDERFKQNTGVDTKQNKSKEEKGSIIQNKLKEMELKKIDKDFKL